MGAWADFTKTYSGATEWVKEGFTAPAEVTSLATSGWTIAKLEYDVEVTSESLTVLFDWNNSAPCGLNTLGIELVNPSTDAIVASHYLKGKDSAASGAAYALSGLTNGSYTLRFYAQEDGVNDAFSKTGGAVTVTGADLSAPTITYTLTDASGNEFVGTYRGEPGVDEPILLGVAGYTLTDKVWNGNAFSATITFPFPVSKVGGTTNSTMIHQGSWSTDKRWHAVDDYVKVQTQDVDPENISEWLWAIYPQLVEGEFSFKIKNISADKYVSVNLESAADATASNKPVTLAAEGTAFTVSASGNYIKFNYVNTAETALHLTINGSGDTDVFLGVYGGSHNGDNIGFPAYSVVTISNVGYSTIYLPFDAVLPEGLTAYAVTATSATSATMTALDGIKANNGAILNGAPATKYVLTAGTVNSDWSTNLLEGSVADTEVTGEAYVLGTVNNVTGFYSALLTNGKFKNNAGRAYLPVAAGARFLSFDFGGNETAIDELKGENGNVKTVIYDLSGRRVQKAQKGLYIVNGKVVIK